MIPIASKDSESKDGEGKSLFKAGDRPPFILKTREGESRAVSPSQRNGSKKEAESSSNSSSKSQDPPRPIVPTCVGMTGCVKFVEENLQLCLNAIDYLSEVHDFVQDHPDYLVVGCLGAQGVGKSTIMSLLTANHGSDIFPAQDISHHESGVNCTTGIDFFVTKNRVIYLDTQPILSTSAIDYAATYDQKKNPTDFANTQNNLELQSLQFAALVLSVCHVIIFVQDWFVDPNLLRFLQTAEMLKPSSAINMDLEDVEHYPHVVFLHNKAEVQDFLSDNVEKMKEFYNKVFLNSKLQTHSGLDMSNHSSEEELNLFLIPSFGSGGTQDSQFYF